MIYTVQLQFIIIKGIKRLPVILTYTTLYESEMFDHLKQGVTLARKLLKKPHFLTQGTI